MLGIGYTTAKVLAQKGYKVYGGARRTERMEPLKEYGVVPLSLDVTDEESSKAVVEYIIKEEGRIDVLMNNAGYGSYGPVEVTSFSEAQNQLDVNVFGVARMMQLVVLNMIRTGTGKAVVPIKVRGPYPYGDIISKELGVEPELSEDNSIQFSLEDMQRPFLTQNNVMWSYLEPELNRRIGELTKEQSFTSLVEKTLYSAIPGNRYSREETAKSLGVSVRTMQRKLSENNTTYAELVQKVEKLLAINYIRIDELSLEEISYLLGYKEQTSFSRAFKSWTGQTFTEYRMANCGRRI